MADGDMSGENPPTGRRVEITSDLDFHKLYVGERTRLIAAKQEQAKTFDQTILTFSAGSIGLSVTFVEKIAPAGTDRTLLYSSWIFFGLALTAILLSFLASQRAAEEELERLDRLYNTGGSAPDISKNAYSIATRWLNRASAAFFIIGIALFAF